MPNILSMIRKYKFNIEISTFFKSNSIYWESFGVWGSIVGLPFFSRRESSCAIGNNLSGKKRPCVRGSPKIRHVSCWRGWGGQGGRVWSIRSVDFSGRGTVATGRKPVVGGRAVHSSDSSLVGYRPSSLRRGERTNDSGGLLLLPLFLHTHENECTHVYRVGGPFGWSSLRSTSIGCRLLVPRTPPFVYQPRRERNKGHPRTFPPFFIQEYR